MQMRCNDNRYSETNVIWRLIQLDTVSERECLLATNSKALFSDSIALSVKALKRALTQGNGIK